MRRTWVFLTVVAAALVSMAAPALAGPIIDRAAAGLRSDPVYVDSEAGASLSSSEADDLRRRIREGDEPIFVAVLPAGALDEADRNGIAEAVRRAAGTPGTYAVVAGRTFNAGSDYIQAGRLATAVTQDHQGDSPAELLEDFVGRAQQASASAAAGGGAAQPLPVDEQPADDSGGGGSGLGVPLLLIGGGVGGYLLYRNGKRRRAERVQLEGARQALHADLKVLADDVLSLEPEVQIHEEARADYDAGVSRFRWAEAAVPAIDSPDDIPRVERGLAEGHYAMARARAIVRGQEPPAPPPELQHEGSHGEPAVVIRDREPAYAGYDGGWYGGGFFGGNGLFTGILLGSMFGGMGGGWGWGGSGGDDTERYTDDGGGWGGGGGDWGGGDFGGGGDWGGGGGDF